jgi:uncharacterized membrane protein YkvA (DUF1232 family)
LGILDDIVIIPIGITIAIKLIPKDVMHECRLQSEEIFKQGKPNNWIAAIFIILIWIMFVFFILKLILRF